MILRILLTLLVVWFVAVLESPIWLVCYLLHVAYTMLDPLPPVWRVRILAGALISGLVYAGLMEMVDRAARREGHV